VSATRNIVWIASYPKSGNTWVRFMLCNLLFGRQESAAALGTLAPDIHEITPEALTAHAGLVKTHFAYSAALPAADRTAAAIYVVRHPADVLVSNYYYAQRSAGAASESRVDFDRYVDRFVECGGDPRWRQFGMGSWEENVRSWIGARGEIRVLAIRYEDLSADPRKIGGLLAKYLRSASTGQEIDAAVANSSFARMRELEDADIQAQRVGIFYKPYLQAAIDSGRRFMRSGAVGDGSRLLTLEQRSRVANRFGTLLGELGYRIA